MTETPTALEAHVATRPVLTGVQAGAAGNVSDAVAGEDDASLTAGERLLRRAVTQVRPRIWLWLTFLAASHLLGYPLALSFLAAVLAALFFLSVVWQVDFYEEEPWRLVEWTFLWGAVPAIVLALIGETLLGGAAHFLVGSADAQWFDVGFVAPVVEELCKGAVLVALFRRHRAEFDGRLDGLVYGALVGLGFSMTENAFYYMSAEGDHLHTAIVVRGLLFGMNHACFTACTGFGLGVASDTTRPARRRWAPVAGLAAAIALHMALNLMANADDVALRFALPLALTACAVLGWFRLVSVARTREAHWIESELADEVQADVMTADEAAATRSVQKRKAARSTALLEKSYGPAHVRLRMYALATELAFAKHKARIDPARADAARIEALRRAIARTRPQQPELAPQAGARSAD